MTEEVLEKVGKEAREKIVFFCKMERSRSFILNEEDFVKQFKEQETDLSTTLPVDNSKFATELRIISNVYAYFSIASKRLLETIPMICEIAFAQGLGEKLRKDFTKELKLTGEFGLQNCIKFAQEEPAIRDKRQHLERMKKIVEESFRVLNETRS